MPPWTWSLEAQVPKLSSVELLKEKSTKLDHFHAIQKARKHLKGKAQKWAIKSTNEITNLDNDKDIIDFLDSSSNDFQKFLPTNIRCYC